MIKCGRQPGRALVAGLATCSGGYVIRRFADRLHIVVAGRTGTERLRVVEAHRGREARRGVAGGATIGAQNMRGGLGRSVDPCADRVAGDAIARRALEDGIDVAAFAAHFQVLALQFKTRRQVIELVGGRSGSPHVP